MLLLGGFDAMVDEVIDGLERRGHPGVTATHEFALSAVDAGAQSASDLARSLNVSRQAAAKTIAALEELGYLERRDDQTDARRKTLVVTIHGHDMVTIGAAAFDELHARWSAQIGPSRLESIESALTTLIPRPKTSPQPPGR